MAGSKGLQNVQEGASIGIHRTCSRILPCMFRYCIVFSSFLSQQKLLMWTTERLRCRFLDHFRKAATSGMAAGPTLDCRLVLRQTFGTKIDSISRKIMCVYNFASILSNRSATVQHVCNLNFTLSRGYMFLALGLLRLVLHSRSFHCHL